MTPSFRLDLHVHSRHSPDSSLSIETLVAAATERGIRGFALTDHNSVAGHAELASWAGRRPDLLLIPGVEVSTRQGHLLGYGIAELPPSGRDATETVAWIVARGGAAVPAHPSRLVHGIGIRRTSGLDVSALEARNGHTSRWGNRSVERLAARRRIGTTGGSDVHDLSDLGRCLTEFPEDVGDIASAVAAIRAGRTRAVGREIDPLERARLAARQGWARARRGLRAI